jgi:predicted acyltransferase
MTPVSEAKPAETKPAEGAAAGQRLMSVDALRGFDMFWIIGADSLVYALNQMSQTAPTKFLAGQLDHANWEGFHFYDLIFPLFVFIAGVSLVFSLSKAIARAGRAEALKRVFWRSVLLFLAGIFYSGGLTHRWPDIRLMGVLNRIALAGGHRGEHPGRVLGFDDLRADSRHSIDPPQHRPVGRPGGR